MSNFDSTDRDRVDQEIRINELREEANDLSGGRMHAWEEPDCPPDLEESFWRHVVEYEKAPWTSDFEQLVSGGFRPPDPRTLGDGEVTAALRQLVDKLATMRVYLANTDHLSDRELYELLWGDILHEATKIMPGGDCHIDILGGCSSEDMELYLRYYADDKWRADWAKDWPEDSPREKPPFDRDRHLPKSTIE